MIIPILLIEIQKRKERFSASCLPFSASQQHLRIMPDADEQPHDRNIVQKKQHQRLFKVKVYELALQ